MIFVTLGSQKFQFNRLLKKIEELIEDNKIKEEVIAQIGYSDYVPKNIECYKFLDRDELISYIEKANIVITHGGTGAIINAVKKEKKVIAVPRLALYGEHVDDHQMQIIEEFYEMKLIEKVEDLSKLENYITIIKEKEYNKYISNTQAIIDSIKEFIEKVDEEVK